MLGAFLHAIYFVLLDACCWAALVEHVNAAAAHVSNTRRSPQSAKQQQTKQSRVELCRRSNQIKSWFELKGDMMLFYIVDHCVTCPCWTWTHISHGFQSLWRLRKQIGVKPGSGFIVATVTARDLPIRLQIHQLRSLLRWKPCRTSV